MSSRPRSTVTTSPSPYSPLSDTTNSSVEPSLPSPGPDTDHCPGPVTGLLPELPAGLFGSCASLIVEVIFAPDGSTSTIPPVEEVALVKPRVKSSGPSSNPSSVNASSITRSGIAVLSDGDVKEMVPVTGSNVISGLASTASCTAVTKSAWSLLFVPLSAKPRSTVSTSPSP